ncbi:MAG: alkaline phosphatase [Deltaproteobacteria bacterium]|nr:alkaline phosphatase [Deltaproteobacteria bacterium]
MLEATIAVMPPVLVGAGDIADCALDGDDATAALVQAIPGFVFTAGDNAYQDGTALDFADCYDPSWGRFRTRTRPTPGGHDYRTPGGAGYYAYFGPSAGTPGQGYYSYEVGAWHVVALNSNIPRDSSSPQFAWLRADLAANHKHCLLAYVYHPRFSSGQHGSVAAMQPIWEMLYAAGAEVVISGHDHLYERFVPQRPDGTPDPAQGIRQFTVGTGGALLTGIRLRLPTSEFVQTGRWGVLRLALNDSSYQWEFVQAPGGRMLDSGTGTCH